MQNLLGVLHICITNIILNAKSINFNANLYLHVRQNEVASAARGVFRQRHRVSAIIREVYQSPACIDKAGRDLSIAGMYIQSRGSI